MKQTICLRAAAVLLSVLLAACSHYGGNNSASDERIAPELASPAVAEPASLPPSVFSAPAERSAQSPAPSEKLGTQWGEGISSSVMTVDVRRLSSQPLDVLEIRYSAARHRGKLIREAQLDNGRIGFSILDDNNRKWTLTKNGRNLYLRGRNGERYQLFYRNYSQNTYEIVATVDGLDVLNGSPGSLANTGYVLNPGGTLVIEGFRKSQDEVAAFRFSAPRDAYAANSAAGSPHNVGVIGTAVFALSDSRPRPRTPAPGPKAFPGDDRFAPPPDYQR